MTQDQVINIATDPGNYYVNADEAERERLREWVKGILRSQEITVEFTKATGEFRRMKCTLSEAHGAKYTVNESKEKPQKKPNPEVCVVWDSTAQAWRSFRWDRLSKVEFEIG